ncbi:MAG: D-2-hydroxyacid dehydrogenase [Bryobacterales bacterium]|nr:D-2-hydroxyacid dehydrogenase [Bryobacterales bacterium]
MPESRFTRRAIRAASAAAGPASTQLAALPQAAGAGAAKTLKIVTMYKFEPHEVEKIQAAAAEHAQVEIVICATRDEFKTRLRDADAVYGDLRGSDLDFAPKVKWLQAGGAGMEGMDPAFRERGPVTTNYARIFAPGISETAIGMLLCLSRGIVKHYLPQFYRNKTNNPVGSAKSDHHVEMVGRTMGIVGMGGIGQAIARRAHYGLDMRIIATDAEPIHKPEYVDELHDPSYFMKMVPQVDVLVAAAPHTKQTERMFNEQVFRSMKKTAYFLAMSRGKLFDDLALTRALKEGWIAGAGLDVFPTEPVPPGHAIFDCDNVIMSAHTSGWSPDRQVRLIDFYAENVRRFAGGLPLVNVVNKQKGY